MFGVGQLTKAEASEACCRDYLKLFRSIPMVATGEAVIKTNNSATEHHAEFRGNTVVVFASDIHAKCIESSCKDIVAVLIVGLYHIDVMQHGQELGVYFHLKDACTETLLFIRARGQHASKWKRGLSEAMKAKTPSLHDLRIVKSIGRGLFGQIFQVMLLGIHTNQREAYPQISGPVKQEVGIIARATSLTTSEDKNTFALKVYSKSVVFSSVNTFRQVVTERLVIETMSGHPYILPLSFAFQDNKSLFLGTPFCSGGDMLSYHRKHASLSVELLPSPSSNRCHSLVLFRRLPRNVIRKVFAQIVVGLSKLHANGVIHRGVKLENILIESSGNIRLSDFSHVAFIEEAHESPKSDPFISDRLLVMRARNKGGSDLYTAPEASEGQYSFSADVWSLGVSMYRLLSGKAPYFRCKKHEKVDGECSVSRKLFLPPKLHKDLRSLLIGLLQPRVERRLTLEQVRKHGFFRGVKWRALERGKSEPALLNVVNATRNNLVEPRNDESLSWFAKKGDTEDATNVCRRVIGYEFIRKLDSSTS